MLHFYLAGGANVLLLCNYHHLSSLRDGGRADSKVLARLTGTRDQNPQFVTSTGNKLYLYTKTDQADSRRGYRIEYYEGKYIHTQNTNAENTCINQEFEQDW